MSGPDVVVIGAGAAGLAAAKTLIAHGFAVQVVESRGRIGGRAWTDTSHYSVPVDLGCSWLHSADVNPFLDIAAELGFHVKRTEPGWTGRRRIGQLSDAERSAVETTISDGLEAIHEAGEAGEDIAASAVLDTQAPGRPLLDAVISWIYGADPDQVSTIDAARYRDTGHNWPVKEGYGALVQAYGAGLPVALNTRATVIDWSGPGVSVTTSAGRIKARAAVVALPTTVMAEDRVRFTPDLPAKKRSAMENLPLGVADKVFFRLIGEPADMSADSFVRGRHDTSRTCSLQIRPFGRDIVNCYFGGRFAREMEEQGTMVEAARAELVNAFGSKVTQHLTDPRATAWFLDPDSRGSYSAALPGHGHRRADLAAPLEDRLFFAGEACSPDFFSTCHGGYLSGIAAADAAAAALKSPQ